MSFKLPSSTRDEPRSPDFGFSGGFQAPRVMERAHRHQEIEINYLTSGAMTYLGAAGVVEIPARRFCVFWGAAPHQLIAVREAESLYYFTIPFAWVAQWRLSKDWMNALLHGEVLSDDSGESSDGDEICCARWHLDLQNGDAEELRAAQLEMEARLRRLARRKTRISPAASATLPHGSDAKQQGDAVQQIAETVARNYARALSVAEIVAPTGLNPNYAMALFRSTCGLSVGDYVLQHRLFHARRLLLTTDLSILDVALDSGFGSLSRFYEAFKRANGCSPQKFRRQTPLQK